MTYAYKMIPDGTGYVDETGPHRGQPPTEEDYKRISIVMAHRLLFGPYDAEIVQEVPIEEVNRRYPNAHIPDGG